MRTEHVTRIDCHNIVRHLLAKRYLRVVTVRSHISEADRELHREAELQKRIQEEYGRLPTARQIQQARAANVANDDLLVEAKEEEEDYAEALVGGVRRHRPLTSPR
jgi:transcription termination factor NusB